MAPHSSILAWKVPWTERPGELQSMRSQRDTTEWLSTHCRIPVCCKPVSRTPACYTLVCCTPVCCKPVKHLFVTHLSAHTCHTPVCCKPVCLSVILPGDFSLMLILSWSSGVEFAQFLSGIILFHFHLWWCSYRFAVIFFQPLKDALSLPPNFPLFWWENYYKSAAATMKLMFIFPLIVFNN